jgi:hypothetical protein
MRRCESWARRQAPTLTEPGRSPRGEATLRMARLRWDHWRTEWLTRRMMLTFAVRRSITSVTPIETWTLSLMEIQGRRRPGRPTTRRSSPHGLRPAHATESQ